MTTPDVAAVTRIEVYPRSAVVGRQSEQQVLVTAFYSDGSQRDVTREAIASLFQNGIDPMVVIRWKDLFERLEEAVDAAETVANILEGIVIKNS